LSWCAGKPAYANAYRLHAPATWTIYKAAAKQTRLGEIEADDEREAVEKAAREFGQRHCDDPGRAVTYRTSWRTGQHRHPSGICDCLCWRALIARCATGPAASIQDACSVVRRSGGAVSSVFLMFGLPVETWERLGLWLVVGLALYFLYGVHHSRLAVPAL